MQALKEYIEGKLGARVVSMPSGSGMLEMESGARYFLKQGPSSRAYRCEADGLAELAKAAVVNVPQVVLVDDRLIITEYIESGRPSTGFYGRLGNMVAAMHRVTAPEFGFYEDNFIGGNPQINTVAGGGVDNWADFYYRNRLIFQIGPAKENGYGRELTPQRLGRLEKAVYYLLEGIDEPPSLLHGDLWAGNYLCSSDGIPYLIDPAVYYGHRETDIAMTMLFGGFPGEFYDAYNQAYPLREGWRERIPLYQLYHLLNHLNLFGGGYLRGVLGILDGL